MSLNSSRGVLVTDVNSDRLWGRFHSYFFSKFCLNGLTVLRLRPWLLHFPSISPKDWMDRHLLDLRWAII